jgi:hypothetical protein
MTTHITCNYVKEAFKFPNYNVVECEDEKENMPPEGNISAIRVDVNDSWSESEIQSGLIHGGCQVFPHKIGCRKVPFILKFECDDCVSQGSKLMLTTCCNACKQFVDGLASNPLIPSNTLPIGFCSGCDSKFYTFEDSPMPNFRPAPWTDYKRFTEYTEAKALEKYNTYIEDNVCTHLTPHCDVADLAANGKDYAEKCHTGSCPADPPLGPSGRRLESWEPTREEMNNTSSVQGSLYYCPESNTWQPLDPPSSPSSPFPEPVGEPKAVIKTTMGLPGLREMYQTAEAKTALRHAFANTLQEVLEWWITVSVNAAGGGRRLSVADFGALCSLSRRLSVVSVEFTISVPSTSTVAATAVTQNVESVAFDNSALAMNLERSFADYAPAINVTNVDFNKAVVSEPEIVVREESTSTPGTPLPRTAPPTEETQQTDLAIVGGAVVLGLGLIGGIVAAASQWRKKKNNAEEPSAAQEQEASVAPLDVQFADLEKLPMDGKVALTDVTVAIGASPPCEAVCDEVDSMLATAVTAKEDSFSETCSHV